MFGISAQVNLRKRPCEIQKPCLRLVLDDSESDYGNWIKNSGTTTMEIKRLSILSTEIFKTITCVNPSYMKKIYSPKTKAEILPHDIMARYSDIIIL